MPLHDRTTSVDHFIVKVPSLRNISDKALREVQRKRSLDWLSSPEDTLPQVRFALLLSQQGVNTTDCLGAITNSETYSFSATGSDITRNQHIRHSSFQRAGLAVCERPLS